MYAMGGFITVIVMRGTKYTRLEQMVAIGALSMMTILVVLTSSENGFTTTKIMMPVKKFAV